VKILFVVPYGRELAPGQRFRFEQWLSLLADDAIEAEVRPLLDAAAYGRFYEPGGSLRKGSQLGLGLGRRLVDALGPSRWDAVFLFREAFFLGRPILESLLERRYPVVYDFDDAIFVGDTSEANAFVARWKYPDKVARIIEHAVITTVGNEWLAMFARQHSSRVEVVPTTIDVDLYQPQPRARNNPIRVGWSGSRTTSAHLHAIDDALRRIAEELPVELVTIGDPAFRLDGAPEVQTLPWRYDTELDDLRSLDIGLMPLPDEDWTRGKCGLKALQYMALGIPTVVSPVGVNTDIVTDGQNGMVATTTEEWFDAVAALVESEALSRRLGDAGRQTVVDRYSGQAWAPRFLELLEEAASSGR
jgi:glycosyltransferase involved in cell wall biosynthesis